MDTCITGIPIREKKDLKAVMPGQVAYHAAYSLSRSFRGINSSTKWNLELKNNTEEFTH